MLRTGERGRMIRRIVVYAGLLFAACLLLLLGEWNGVPLTSVLFSSAFGKGSRCWGVIDRSGRTVLGPAGSGAIIVIGAEAIEPILS